jgi:hypothetical protein
MMSTCCSKHVEAWDKYIEKECVKLDINQNYVEMHGQQNIKKKIQAAVNIFFHFFYVVTKPYHWLIPLQSFKYKS